MVIRRESKRETHEERRVTKARGRRQTGHGPLSWLPPTFMPVSHRVLPAPMRSMA